MKKKIVTMLLALILVISLVPMAAMAECAHPATGLFWVSQGPSGHIRMCPCGQYVDTSSAGAHTYANDVCTLCSYPAPETPEPTQPEETKPEETQPEETKPEGCDCGLADGKKAKYIGGGKHEIACEHGKVVNTTWCTKGNDGKCIGCGHDMEEKPAKGLDNVPKTGDNGSIIAITFATVLAVFGGAYLFTKKRAF